MAREYGGRYLNLNRAIGGGAQGDVLLVQDERDPLKKQYALKRLKKVDRLGRFLAEINALKSLVHPNIVPIVDHSGDPVVGAQNHKYWFVMPVASGTLEGRAGLYKGNLDGVLQVGLGLIGALEAAHAAGIVHRDVKPANILFPQMDNHVWLADFGICHHAAAKERLSEIGEVVGPRGFTAPELETGTLDEVRPSADLYSLGKVLYFMLSGGLRVAREKLDDPLYLSAFANGERYGLLRTLLGRMIASQDRRIATAAEVQHELLRIQHWDQHAHALSLSPSALASITAAQRIAQQRIDTVAENARIMDDRDAVVKSVTDNIVTWLDGELQKIASHLSRSGTHEARVVDATWIKDERFVVEEGHDGSYVGVRGKQIEIKDKSSAFPTWFVLKFYACELRKVRFFLGNDVTPIKAVEPKMALIPFVADQGEGGKLNLRPGMRTPWGMGGFINDKKAMEKSRREYLQRMGPRHHYSDPPQIASSFIGFTYNVAVDFHASDWPGVVEQFRSLISDAFEALLTWSTSNPRSVGR